VHRPLPSNDRTGRAPPRARATRHLLSEATLANARLSYEQKQAPPAGDGSIEGAAQLVELRLATDKDSSFGVAIAVRLCRGGDEVERGVLGQDRLLELPKLAARLDPEFLGQRAPCVSIYLERLGLSPRSVEGEHELRSRSFAQRLLGHQLLEFADHLCVAPAFQVSLDAVLECR
jgi:hypothetical protein